MKYKVVVDTREKKLFQYLKKVIPTTLCSIEIKVLTLGDVLITNEEGDIIFVIERKSIADLAASILDGRYTEQSYRYNKMKTHNHNIIYIIEGVMNDLTLRFSNIDKKSIYSAMISIQYMKGFSLFRSSNLEDTAYYISRLVHKLKQPKKTLYYKEGHEKRENTTIMIDISGNGTSTQTDPSITQFEYTDAVKSSVKNKQITKENINVLFLNQIPFVSHTTSKCIVEKVGSIYELVKHLKEDECYLDTFKYMNSSGKERKLSKKSIDSIKHYLL